MVKFGPHSFTTTITDIIQARQVDLVNTPDRRERLDGTFYTPTVVTFLCGDGKLHFVLEDVEAVVETLKGITIKLVGNTQVTLCKQ